MARCDQRYYWPGLPSRSLPGWPGGGSPNGEPDFDPELTKSDDPLAPPGTPPEIVPEPQGGPTSVPEPSVFLLLGVGLLGLAIMGARPSNG